ncbi:serine/threonine-protein kinase [uncultured Paracoccus sp.]|uniref:serine/threonine-protein kinase n=1 Tax=uncultured Paracoccus sp. TaxID=189685 RepID=UPI0025FD1490|nr:serine/threonine-protein kinase [uncultured Paracoccus sp.]
MSDPEKDRPDTSPPGDDRTRIAPSDPAADGPAQGDATRIADTESPPDAPADIVQPGVLINDNYRILDTVSAGGMGEVYRAENIFTGDPVAVKIILPNLARDESIIDLFRREARILVQMRDDAIVRYHNFVRDKGLDRYCLIMEFVDGQHLWDRVKQAGALDADQALVLLRRLAKGLAQAHARGVTHRDLSPDNVILRDNRIEEAVLIDFGIARSTELGDGLAGRFAGKFKYIAPEQMGHGRGEVGPAADVYGLALMIAAAVRGEPLDMGTNIVDASEARRSIPDLTGISHRVYPLLQHMLEPDPEMRPHDMEALLNILDDPSHLPARYRMPLWHARPAPASPTTQAEDDVTGSLGRLSRTSARSDLDSSSPFAGLEPPPPVAMPVQKTRKLRPWLLAGAAAAVLTAGAGAFLLRGDPPAPETPAQIAEAEPDDLPPLPARDIQTRDGFLAEQAVAPCTFVSRIPTGADAGKLGALSDQPQSFDELLRAYSGQFGTSPAVVFARTTQAQCAALDFARALSGRVAAPPALSLDMASTISGESVSGRIRELRGRSLWLFVVSSRGGVYDLSSTAVAQADGSFAFDFGISLAADEAGPQPQLVMALASDAPLASVAAAPAGSNAGTLLPLVMDEIRRNGGNAALDLALLTVRPDLPPEAEPDEAEPDGDAAPGSP